VVVSKRTLSEFAARGAAAQRAVDKLTASRKKPAKKGATYPMRELAELARGSARVWEGWAASMPPKRAEIAYGARTLSHLWQAIAHVMDVMADRELPDDEPPPLGAFCKPPK